MADKKTQEPETPAQEPEPVPETVDYTKQLEGMEKEQKASQEKDAKRTT